MARYINLDEALKYLHNDCKAQYPLCYANGLADSINELSKLPTADVVPKSEYDRLEKLLKDMTQEAKGYLNRLYGIRADVAREIFEEIEETLDHHYEEWDFCYYDDYLGEDIAELKKKYTEEKKDEN